MILNMFLYLLAVVPVRLVTLCHNSPSNNFNLGKIYNSTIPDSSLSIPKSEVGWCIPSIYSTYLLIPIVSNKYFSRNIFQTIHHVHRNVINKTFDNNEIPFFFSVVYYTYSLGLIAATAMLSMAVKSMSAVNKPLPRGVTWFLHSGYLVYLGIEINVRTSGPRRHTQPRQF